MLRSLAVTVRGSRVELRTVKVVEVEDRSEERVAIWCAPVASRSQGSRTDETLIRRQTLVANRSLRGGASFGGKCVCVSKRSGRAPATQARRRRIAKPCTGTPSLRLPEFSWATSDRRSSSAGVANSYPPVAQRPASVPLPLARPPRDTVQHAQIASLPLVLSHGGHPRVQTRSPSRNGPRRAVSRFQPTTFAKSKGPPAVFSTPHARAAAMQDHHG